MPPIGYEYLHACGLDVVDMHKNIGAAVIGRDKATRERLEDLYGAPVEKLTDAATGHAAFLPG